jgi:hypothetical protein
MDKRHQKVMYEKATRRENRLVQGIMGDTNNSEIEAFSSLV